MIKVYLRFLVVAVSSPLGHFLHGRIPPVENGPFRLDFFWLGSSGRSSYRQLSRFCGCCALPRGCWCEGVLLCCCCMAVESRLAALCFARSPRATRASRATNPRPSGLVALDNSPKSLKLHLWRCTQPRAAKAAAGVAVGGKITSILRAAVVV